MSVMILYCVKDYLVFQLIHEALKLVLGLGFSLAISQLHCVHHITEVLHLLLMSSDHLLSGSMWCECAD